MIQRSSDGNTLTGVDNGKSFSHNKMEGAPFDEMLVTLDAQMQAERENTQTLLDYNQKLGNVQGPLDAGQAPAGTPVAPPKPQAKIVSDTGVVSSAPFDPPLADLVIPKTTPSQVNTGAGGGLSDHDMLLRLYQVAFPNGDPAYPAKG
jgi:hypothetical protein